MIITKLVKLKDNLVKDCRENKREADYYREQLLSALAEIERENKFRAGFKPPMNPINVDLSPLHRHDFDILLPYLAAIDKHNRKVEGTILSKHKIKIDALAKVK